MAASVKFLIVDDREDNIHALQALLRRDDIEILTARSGRDALELLLVHEVALAFLDVQMPEMDGFELAELMRGSERTRQVPIIFVTAGARDQTRLFKGYEAGAVDFLFKPIEPHILRHKAETFFQLYQQRRQLAEQLDELHAIAKEREELVGELKGALRLAEMFTAVLGHDLRNPLSVIINGAELLLRRAGEDGPVRKSAERMRSSGRRMARMIDEMLDLSRARLAGGIPLAPRAVNLLALCQKVVAEHEVSHPERRVELHHEGNVEGVWDEDRLFQVLSNLVGNAFHHGRADRAVVLRLDATQPHEAVIEVRNGGAIPAGMLPQLFDPFRSVHKKTERNDGLGLGLYIVQQIVLAHGGTVNVTSTEQDGTSFVVRLPRVAPRSEARSAAG
jgi:two-component system sensor histidine kinase/response regulator